jgi:hypothetical protein
VAWGSSAALPVFFLALLAGQDQQFGVGRQHVAHDILKFAPGGDLPLHLIHPIPGDALDMSLAFHHEGEGPSLMTLLVSAMAAGIPAARVTAGEGSGQQIGRDGETAQELKLALAQAGGLQASRFFFFHIVVMMLQVRPQCNVLF